MNVSDLRDLLLAPHLHPEEVAARLHPYGFRRPAQADRNLQALAEDPIARGLLADLLPDLLACLADSADPDGALDRLERFFRSAGATAALLSHLKGAPRGIELLTRTLGASPFLADILVRHPNWFYWLSDPEVLARRRTRAEIEEDLARALAPLKGEARRLGALRVAKRREILHIGVRDLLRLARVEETLAALSTLAEALLRKACEEAARAVGQGHRPAVVKGFAVLGLGKLGGGELNFSSDVDLIFVCGSDADPDPDRAALARRLTDALSSVTDEGYVYRVDLRLRPEGRVGRVVPSLEACDLYYRTRGATWERLALVKAWPVAGDRALGRRFLAATEPFVFARAFDAAALDEILEMKRRIDRKVALRDESGRHVKLGVGGIREIELVAQVLQVRFGGERRALRDRNTRRALARLRRASLLSREEHAALLSGYMFLRDVENKLQMVSDVQTHTLPESPEELRICARRLGYTETQGVDAGEALLRDYRSHTEAVHRIFADVLQAGRLGVA